MPDIVSITGVISENGGAGGLTESMANFDKHYRTMGDNLLNISGIGTRDGKPAHKDAPRLPVQHMPFPKMLYHQDGRELIVDNEKEELNAMKNDGFRREPFPKVQVAVADAATEKKELLDVIKELKGALRSQQEQIETLKSQLSGQGRK